MKKTLLVVLIMAILVFSGCEYADFGAEGLLAAPKLNEEQSLIHQALVSSVGKNAKLKYPRSGDNRSSYVLVNLDDEVTEEAIVFYEKTGSNQSSVRINVLDQIDGKWKSVYDMGGVSSEVDKIMISKLGENEPVNIVIGFGSSSSIEKSLFIYRYDDGILTEVYSDVYNTMDMIDFDNNGINELVTVTNSSETSLASAKMFSCIDGIITCVSGTEMDGTTLMFSSYVKGNIFTDTKAIYLDGSLGNGTIKTEILIFRNGGLQNLMYSKYNKMADKTVRPIGYNCVDVDSDGTVEIPVTTAFTGYEAYPAQEQLLSTDWYTYEGYFSLKKKYSGYYNINDAYVFMIPSRWQGLVTVKRDTVTDEIVFYRYDGEINDNMTELMRIRVSTRQETNDLIYKGYSLITSKGQLDYLVKLGESSRQPLVLTMAEVINNFYVL
ncbi:MAG: hypothetical protein WC900_07770 [Oscillospiraceae bacterium]|jgi:hypothetical protein